MASRLAPLSCARFPGTLPQEDNSLLGFVQSAILQGFNALLLLACLALTIFVSGSSIFSCAVLALCLRLCPRSPDRQYRPLIRPTNSAKIQEVLLRFLEELLRTNLQCQLVCVIRLVEVVRWTVTGDEGFGEPLKPSPRRLHLHSPEHRQQLTASRPLKAQRGSRDCHFSCSSSQQSKRLKRGDDHLPPGWSEARGDDHGPSILLQDKSSPLLQQQSHLPIQGTDCLARRSSRGHPGKGHHPRPLHPSQPYHAQLPTPPETPRPPSVPPPPEDHLSQTATHRPAAGPSSSTVWLSPKVPRWTSQSRAKSKQQEIHTLHSLPLADACQHEQPERTELAPALERTRASSEAGGRLQTTEARPQFDAEPDGITYVGADRKRSRQAQGSSRSQGNAASTQNTNENEEFPNPPSEDEFESADEHRDLNPNRNEKTTPDRKARGLFFRCPMYSADPQKHACTRCNHWRNPSIAAVTRHALNDAGERTDKWNKIKELSKVKLTPEERWRRYFVIFSNGTENDQMNHPYWVNADREDQVTDFLKSMIDRLSSDPDPTQAFRRIQQYYEMLMEKKRRDNGIRLQCQEKKTAAMRQELEDLETSQSILNTTFERFVATGFSETTSNHCYALQGLTAPTEMPMQRSCSGKGPEIGMSNLDAQFFDHLKDPSTAGSQRASQVPYNSDIPAAATPFPFSQHLNEVMMRTDIAMDPTRHPSTINAGQSSSIAQWGHRQLYNQQSQTLHPPRPPAYVSDSGVGSSGPSATRPISSANSAEDNPQSFLFNYVTPSGGTSPAVDLGTITNPFAVLPGNANNAPRYTLGNHFMVQ